MVKGWPLCVVLSGGQTGADQAGLRAAKARKYATGGIAPSGFYTEDGPAPWLGTTYNLTCRPGTSYVQRTAQNVRRADGTIVFWAQEIGGVSAGSQLTINEATAQGKPCLVLALDLDNPEPPESDDNDMVDQIRAFIRAHGLTTINIAGNRESVAPGIGARVEAILLRAFVPEGD